MILKKLALNGTSKWCARSLRTVAFLALILIMAADPLQAQAPPSMDAALKPMLEAVQANAYDQFMAQADSAFKTHFPKPMFESLSRQLGPRLQLGYSTTYFGHLNQQAYTVYVWKLALKDGQGDYLLTLFFKDEKVSGFVAR
jgi:hypothetical protein